LKWIFVVQTPDVGAGFVCFGEATFPSTDCLAASPVAAFSGAASVMSFMAAAFVAGASVGGSVGGFVGASVGGAVGASVGGAVGASVGGAVGRAVGGAVGAAVGGAVGAAVGGAVGAFVAFAVTGCAGCVAAGWVTTGSMLSMGLVPFWVG